MAVDPLGEEEDDDDDAAVVTAAAAAAAGGGGAKDKGKGKLDGKIGGELDVEDGEAKHGSGNSPGESNVLGRPRFRLTISRARGCGGCINGGGAAAAA